jgi:hypothetical protein
MKICASLAATSAGQMPWIAATSQRPRHPDARAGGDMFAINRTLARRLPRDVVIAANSLRIVGVV